MTLAGVELEMRVYEPDALTTRLDQCASGYKPSPVENYWGDGSSAIFLATPVSSKSLDLDLRFLSIFKLCRLQPLFKSRQVCDLILHVVLASRSNSTSSYVHDVMRFVSVYTPTQSLLRLVSFNESGSPRLP